MKDLEINLIENGLDFFLEAVEYLEKENPRNLKYAILHIASAVELVLKARLASEHWVLIFDDPFLSGIELISKTHLANEHRPLIFKKTPSEKELKKLKEGNFRSANFQDVQQRLESICKLDLTDHRPILEKLRIMRNRIQHYNCSLQLSETTPILLKTWSFLWDFVHDHISEEMDTHQPLLEKIKKHMIKHEEYVKHRRKEIDSDLNTFRKEGYLVIDCPSCLEETLFIPGGEEPICYFCRYQKNSEQVADDWATVFVGYPHTDPKECLIYPVIQECPNCGLERAIYFEDGGVTPPDPVWICFSCGDSGSPMVTCNSCGDDFPWEADDDVYICPECRVSEGNQPI